MYLGEKSVKVNNYHHADVVVRLLPPLAATGATIAAIAWRAACHGRPVVTVALYDQCTDSPTGRLADWMAESIDPAAAF